MQINNVLNAVFSAQSNMIIMRAMINYNLGITGREVSRITGLSPRACLNSLSSLESLGIIKRLRGGRDHSFQLNTRHFLYSEVISPLLIAEKKFQDAIKKDITYKLKGKCRSIYVFGSVARKEDSSGSDLDVCIVINNKKDQRTLENEITELSKDIIQKYGITLSPFFITANDFTHKYNLNKAPVADIVKEGILIYGSKIINNGKKN